MPQCCRCNTSGVCKACTCVGNGVFCTSCTAGSAGRCMNRPDCDERSDSADKLANKQAELPSSVTTDDGLSEAEDPESDNFDHHAGLSKAKALAMTAILGKNDHAAGDASEAAGSPVPYPEVKDDDPDSDWEQRTTQRTVSTHTPSVLDDINELLAKGREESKIREYRLNKSIEDLNGKLHQLITLVEKQTKILDHERSAAQDRETRLKKKIQNLEDTVSRLSEVQEKTLRESNEGREKIARQLSDLKSNSTLQAKKLEKRHQPRHEEKKELECGSTSESPSCSSSSNPGHVETQPNSRDHSKGRPQGNTHGKEQTSSEPKVNMPSRNADPSVSAHKDEEGKKSAKMLIDDHHAGVSGMRSASDNESGSPEPVPDLELSKDFDAGEKRPQQPQESSSSSPKTYSAITASEETSDSTNAWQQVKRRGKKSSRGPSPDSTRRQSELKGAMRIKKSVFYISGIDVSCPEDTLVDYCLNRQVRVASCGFLNSKHFGTKSARLVVSADDAEATNIVNESFWPENIRARPWKFPETPPDRKDEHPRWLKARSQ